MSLFKQGSIKIHCVACASACEPIFEVLVCVRRTLEHIATQHQICNILMSLLYFSDSCNAIACLAMDLKCSSFDRYWQISLKSMRKKKDKEILQKCKRSMRKLTRRKNIYQVYLENHEKNCSILKLHPTRHWKNASPTYSNVFNVQHKHNSRITMGQLKAIKLQGLISVFFKSFQIIKKGLGKN